MAIKIVLLPHGAPESELGCLAVLHKGEGFVLARRGFRVGWRFQELRESVVLTYF